MSSFALDLRISEHYFEFDRLEHRDGCKLFGTGMWEVARMRIEAGPVFAEDQVVTRMLCRQCAAVHLVAADADKRRATSIDQIGYGGRPERAAGLWLHPGPPMFPGDDDGPWEYYASGSPDAPARPEDVIGLIARRHGQRGGTLWRAGYGVRKGTYRGYHVDRQGPHYFRSRAAAAKWLAAQHAQALTEASA